MEDKVSYELECRWKFAGRMLAWSYVLTRKTLEQARQTRKDMLMRYARQVADVDYDIRIVKVTETKTRQVLWLEGATA